MTSEVMANGKNKLDPALTDLYTTLREAENIPSTEEELAFLSELLQSKELNALVNVHNKILTNVDRKHFFPIPVLSDAMQVMADVLEVLISRPYMSEDCKELFSVLQRPHLQGLLCAHDSVAQKDYYPHLPELPPEPDDDEETIKIVQLVKSNEPLSGTQSAEPIVGATIKTDETTGKIVIARVMHGGAADRSGLIHVGDEVVEVNNINVEGKTPNDVLQILQNSEGTITFKLIPAECKTNARESKVRVRAHFNYIALMDPYIPCKEAALDFKKGDVLHIVCQDDQYWWQARKEGDRHMRAGLIPSRALQEKRIVHERTEENNEEADVTSRPMKPGEVNGKEYYFVAREQMEEDIERGKFIEFGEYKGNLYGTSSDSVKAIVNSGHVCILNPHYQALKMLRTAQLKPYIVYIKPPRLEILKETRMANHARSTFDANNSRGFTEDEFKDMLRSAERIEFLYDHFFDETIVNDDLMVAFGKLLGAVNRAETEPLWVPASWVQ
ncbi:MAGUK p55 subfamily member 7 isoform X6 [Cylas formicarius]|uniref:MAGUK p55 subfamily member 7 isoform X6 n=1 Tax=Cylas formicarius TaxID=197179 RepID=UPI002958C730|nr:MAGUK p55 subfamily member 7 isoform X6 [Cylas formicarius]